GPPGFPPDDGGLLRNEGPAVPPSPGRGCGAARRRCLRRRQMGPASRRHDCGLRTPGPDRGGRAPVRCRLAGHRRSRHPVRTPRDLRGCRGRAISYDIGLVGSFNVANSLLAISSVAQLGEDPHAAAAAIEDVQVPGRMQAVDAGQPFLAVVDYAHKPGAVAAVVRTLSDYLPSPTGRIGIVLGAGGNRDHDKRPMMGEEAAKVADAVFVTDDNPRDEEPAPIRSMILDGVRKAAKGRDANGEKVFYDDFPGRANAIRAAVAWARPGDAIVVAGKGHETGQEGRGEIHPFSDLEELAAALEQRPDVDQQASTTIRD